MLFSCLFCLLSRGSVYTVHNFDKMYTVPMAGTLIGTLKAKVPSRDMGLTTDIHPCAQIVSEWLSACLTLHICSRNVQAPVK